MLRFSLSSQRFISHKRKVLLNEEKLKISESISKLTSLSELASFVSLKNKEFIQVNATESFQLLTRFCAERKPDDIEVQTTAQLLLQQLQEEDSQRRRLSPFTLGTVAGCIHQARLFPKLPEFLVESIHKCDFTCSGHRNKTTPQAQALLACASLGHSSVAAKIASEICERKIDSFTTPFTLGLICTAFNALETMPTPNPLQTEFFSQLATQLVDHNKMLKLTPHHVLNVLNCFQRRGELTPAMLLSASQNAKGNVFFTQDQLATLYEMLPTTVEAQVLRNLECRLIPQEMTSRDVLKLKGLKSSSLELVQRSPAFHQLSESDKKAFLQKNPSTQQQEEITGKKEATA